MTDIKHPSNDILEEEYNRVPYTSYPFSQSHPKNLYTLASLFKLKPNAVEKSRILEIGCASGGNIIPIAFEFPHAEILGIDLSKNEINEGLQIIKELDLKNITLRHQSLLDFDQQDGKFDYIICHGVYSWVDKPARKKIFQICHENLTKNGVAYVSYNTLPGWHMVNSVRDFMMWHTKNISEPAQKAKQARVALKFIADGLKEDSSPYATFLKNEIKILSSHADYYLLHEHLSTYNHPVYFYQFMDEAFEHQLNYLCDTNLPMMFTDNLPEQFANELRKIPNIIVNNQYIDFIRNQRFRCTLLCHQDQKIIRNLDINDLEHYYLQLLGKPSKEDFSEKDLIEGEEIKFLNGNLTLSSKKMLPKLALLILYENRHHKIAYSELCEILKKRSKIEDIKEIKNILNNELNLMRALFAGFLQVSLYPSDYSTQLPEKPYTSELIRYQSSHQNYVTNFNHQAVGLDPIIKIILPKLDGTHSIEALHQLVTQCALDKKITFSNPQKEVITDPEIIKKQSQSFCQNRLEYIVKNALLSDLPNDVKTLNHE